MDSHRQSTVYNRYATLIFTNPVFLGFSRYQNVKFGSQRDNLSETRISRKAHFTRVTEVVECCQMCWNLHRMQHICNKYIDMYRTFFGSDTGKCPFLCISTSGAFAGEYWMGVLALTDTYSTANIARQRDMSKITK